MGREGHGARIGEVVQRQAGHAGGRAIGPACIGNAYGRHAVWDAAAAPKALQLRTPPPRVHVSRLSTSVHS